MIKKYELTDCSIDHLEQILGTIPDIDTDLLAELGDTIVHDMCMKGALYIWHDMFQYVGFCLIGPKFGDSQVKLWLMEIDPDLRGRRYGTRLFKHVLEDYPNSPIYLQALDEDAESFWLKQGFYIDIDGFDYQSLIYTDHLHPTHSCFSFSNDRKSSNWRPL